MNYKKDYLVERHRNEAEMKFIEKRLTDSKKYTRFQVQKIMYLIKTLSADTSKVILLGIIFHNHFLTYIVAMTILFLLRSFSGGIHNNTYMGCFMSTLIYFLLSIMIFLSALQAL